MRGEVKHFDLDGVRVAFVNCASKLTEAQKGVIAYMAREMGVEHLVIWYKPRIESVEATAKVLVDVHMIVINGGNIKSKADLLDAICHELAHIKHSNHSEEWFRLYERLVCWMANTVRRKTEREMYKWIKWAKGYYAIESHDESN